MKHSSLRGNLLWLASIYLVSLVVASGCPTSDAPSNRPMAKPASTNPPEPSVNEALSQVETPPVQTPPVQTQPVEPAPVVKEPVAVAARPEPQQPVAPPAVKEPALLPENPNEPKTSIAFKGPAVPVDAGGSGKPIGDEYFAGWEKPQLAIVITGDQNGYMEPCGCAGLENMKGGIGRRQDMIQQLKAKGWQVAAVDLGGLVRRYGKQAELQLASSAEALQLMGYQAVGLGVADLRLSTGEVAAVVAPAAPGKGMFVSTTADVFGVVPKFRVFDAGGMKIGVVSVLGRTKQQEVKNGDVAFTPAIDEINAALPELEKCDIRILLSNSLLEDDKQADDSKKEIDDSKDLARKFPQFDIVVAGDTHGDPPHLLRNVEGDALSNINGRPLPGAQGQVFVEPGDKGMFAIVLAYYPGQKLPNYQRVALDKRYQVTPDMKQVMSTLQKNYQVLGWEGLGIKPRAHERGKFVGSDNCKDCHDKAFKVWKASGHGHATDTLVKLDPPRQFDAECVSCHVTGWNPKEYYPYDSGFLGLKETPHLVGNGCENCHGPGGAHVAAEAGKDELLQTKLRELMHIDIEQASKSCKTCHDLDNSPEFDKKGFDKYWEKIAH